MCTRIALTFIIVLLGLIASASSHAQGPRGRGPMARDPAFVEDRELFHALLEHRHLIQRSVKLLDNGVETVTESESPEVAALIQRHVASMKARVEDRRPIHLRDPLFAALFRRAEKIRFVYEKTERGARVQETSDDPETVTLIQAHAAVVSKFLENGHAEVQKNHIPPKYVPPQVPQRD
jgi:hypothetical protein